VPQAKGVHDHPRPEAKSTSEARRSLGAGRRVRGLAVLLAREAALGSKVIRLEVPSSKCSTLRVITATESFNASLGAVYKPAPYGRECTQAALRPRL